MADRQVASRLRDVLLIRRVIRAREIKILGGATVTAELRAAALMNIRVMVRGYVLAVRRLHDAVERSHAEDIYAALFEATNWLDSLSERDSGFNSRDEVKGVKYVRNRAHHQFASLVQLQNNEWRWRPLENLPLPDERRHHNRKLEPFCKRHLADSSVTAIFETIEPYVVALAPDVDLPDHLRTAPRWPALCISSAPVSTTNERSLAVLGGNKGWGSYNAETPADATVSACLAGCPRPELNQRTRFMKPLLRQVAREPGELTRC